VVCAHGVARPEREGAKVRGLPTPRVNILGRTPIADAEWTHLLDAARLWKSHGAPDREIAWMWAEDYGFDVGEDYVRKLLTGFADEV